MSDVNKYLNYVLSLNDYDKFVAVHNFNGENARCKKEDKDNIFVYSKGKSRYGYRYSIKDFLYYYTPKITDISAEEKSWHRRCKNIETKLIKTGLWPNLRVLYANLQKVSLADKKKMYELYWERDDASKAQLHSYARKYPFAFNANGEINTDYIWELSEAKTKSMYFGYENKRVKEAIKNAMMNKTPFHYRTTVNYDVSFEYSPEKQCAWYSEEYRNCGNGHYYLAIDESSAVFCEND